MRISMKGSTAILLLVIIFASCKKADKIAVHIPRSASLVLAVDLKSISGKLNAGHVSLDSLVGALHDSSQHSKDSGLTWQQIKNSGVDWESNIYFFASQGGSIMEGQHSTEGVLAGLKDRKAFEALLHQHKKDINIQNGDHFSYVFAHGHVLGWNDELAIAIRVTEGNPMAA